MLTGDQNIIDIDFTVQWKIADAGQYLFHIREPEQTVKIAAERRSEEHTSELQSLMRTSYAVFCLKTNNASHSTSSHLRPTIRLTTRLYFTSSHLSAPTTRNHPQT